MHDNPEDKEFNSPDGIILIYDITKKDTYSNLKQYFEDLKKTKQYKYCSFLVVGNKSDQSLERKVDLDDVETYCKKKKFMWGGEMSFKNFDQSFFTNLLKDFTKEIFKKIGEKSVLDRKYEEQLNEFYK